MFRIDLDLLDLDVGVDADLNVDFDLNLDSHWDLGLRFALRFRFRLRKWHLITFKLSFRFILDYSKIRLKWTFEVLTSRRHQTMNCNALWETRDKINLGLY